MPEQMTGQTVQILQTALAGADAAVYAYGVAGPILSGAERTRALDAMAAHRTTRDRLADLVNSAGDTPTPAAPAYDLPFAVARPQAARRLAGLVEDRLAGQLAAVAAMLTGTERSWAARTAQDCAVRNVTWTGAAPVWSGTA